MSLLEEFIDKYHLLRNPFHLENGIIYFHYTDNELIPYLIVNRDGNDSNDKMIGKIYDHKGKLIYDKIDRISNFFCKTRSWMINSFIYDRLPDNSLYILRIKSIVYTKIEKFEPLLKYRDFIFRFSLQKSDLAGLTIDTYKGTTIYKYEPRKMIPIRYFNEKKYEGIDYDLINEYWDFRSHHGGNN